MAGKISNRIIFLSIELNLLLWFAVFAQALIRMPESQSLSWQTPATVDMGLIFIGIGFGAIVQHAAYYWWKNTQRQKEHSIKS
jgi:hypothetical protein